jgi:hypothetical protein
MSGGMGGGEAGVPDDLLTTKGDTHGYSTTNARVPIGADLAVLTADSTTALGLAWTAPAAGYTQPTLGDTVISSGATVATINDLTLTNLKRLQRELGTTLGTTGTIDLDFTANELQLMPAMTGAVVFTGSNYVAGGTKTIRIIGGSSAYGFTFPAGWKFVNAAPTDLAIGKYAVLTLTCTTAAEAGVICAYAVEE